MNARARSTSGSSGSEHGVVVVELEDLHRAGRRGVEAQAAEHALVEVLLDDLERARRPPGEDVDRADLGRAWRRPPRRPATRVVDLDADEQSRRYLMRGLLSAILALMMLGDLARSPRRR